MEAANQAKVDVAEVRMKGEVGAKLREGQTIQNAAKIDAETNVISIQRQGQGKKEIKVKAEVKVFENLRDAQVAQANADLAKKKAGWAKEAQVAEVESKKAVALRDSKLQREVEMMNAMTRTEKLKAEFLSKASVMKPRYKRQTESCTSNKKQLKQSYTRSQKKPKLKRPLQELIFLPSQKPQMENSMQKLKRPREW